jgi:integrase/recombinase XerC
MALEMNAVTVRVGQAPTTLNDAVSCFLADCKARNLSPCTLALNRIILKGLRGALGDAALAEVTANDLRRFLIDKASATSPATAARYYDCIKRFFAFLADDGFIHTNPMQSVAKPRAAVPIIQPLRQEQVEAMIAACGSGFVGLRDRLVLLVLLDCGLRASELCGITLDDVDLENQQFLIRHGKGDRSRRVPFGSAVLATLRQYIAKRAEVDTPELVVNVYGDPVDRYRIRAIVLEAARKAGVTHPHIGPHLLRHTCAVQYLRNGGDTFSLQKVLGHSTLVMTRRYSELADTDVADKHRVFSPADRLKAAVKTTGRRKRLQ